MLLICNRYIYANRACFDNLMKTIGHNDLATSTSSTSRFDLAKIATIFVIFTNQLSFGIYGLGREVKPNFSDGWITAEWTKSAQPCVRAHCVCISKSYTLDG
jgi:hypothetical protein